MSSAKMNDFLLNRAELLKKVRNLTAVEGFVDFGELETEIVDLVTLGMEAGVVQEAEELKFLWVLNDMLEGSPDGRVSEDVWDENLQKINNIPASSTPSTAPQKHPITTSELANPIAIPLLSSPTSAPPQHSGHEGLKRSITYSLSEVEAMQVDEPATVSVAVEDTASALSPPPPIRRFSDLDADSSPAEPSTLDPTPSDEMQVDAIAERDTIVVSKPRKDELPRTGGKSVEYVKSLGNMGEKPRKVVVSVGKRKARDQEEYGGEDSEVESDEETVETSVGDGEEPRKRIPLRKPMSKRRRVVSRETVVSSDEEQAEEMESEEQPKKRKVAGDAWPTFESSTTCAPCSMSGQKCFRFIPTFKSNRTRNACQRCHRVKQRCPFVAKKHHVKKEESESDEDESKIEMRKRKAKDKEVKLRKSKRKQNPVEEKDEEEAEDDKDERKKGKGKSKARDDDRKGKGKEKRKGKGKEKEKGKGKGKEKEKGKGKGKDEAAVKGEEEDDTEWRSVQQDQAGPSSGRIRRPRDEEPRNIAEIYARIHALEIQTTNMEESTDIGFGELNQQVARLDSNAETQKKWVGQRIELVEEQSRSAEHRLSGLQSQVDHVRQRTEDMHSSMLAMHTHSEQLTNGLTVMIDKFKQLRFDIPGMFDDWARMNNPMGDQRLIRSDQLHSEGINSGMPIISPLNRFPMLPPSGPAPPPPKTPTPPQLPSQPPSDEESPSKVFRKYMYSQPTAERDALQEIGGPFDIDRAYPSDGAESDENRLRGGLSRDGTGLSYEFDVVIDSEQRSPGILGGNGAAADVEVMRAKEVDSDVEEKVGAEADIEEKVGAEGTDTGHSQDEDEGPKAEGKVERDEVLDEPQVEDDSGTERMEAEDVEMGRTVGLDREDMTGEDDSGTERMEAEDVEMGQTVGLDREDMTGDSQVHRNDVREFREDGEDLGPEMKESEDVDMGQSLSTIGEEEGSGIFNREATLPLSEDQLDSGSHTHIPSPDDSPAINAPAQATPSASAVLTSDNIVATTPPHSVASISSGVGRTPIMPEESTSRLTPSSGPMTRSRSRSASVVLGSPPGAITRSRSGSRLPSIQPEASRPRQTRSSSRKPPSKNR